MHMYSQKSRDLVHVLEQHTALVTGVQLNANNLFQVCVYMRMSVPLPSVCVCVYILYVYISVCMLVYTYVCQCEWVHYCSVLLCSVACMMYGYCVMRNPSVVCACMHVAANLY